MFECWVNSPKNRAYVITNMINRVRNNLKLKIEKMNIDKQLKINKKKKPIVQFKRALYSQF